MEEKKHEKLFNKDYLSLLIGGLVSSFGAILYSAAVSYYVYEKTGSTTLMGIISSISFFTIVILSPFTGAITDHLKRRNVIVVADLVRGVFFTIIGLLTLKDNVPNAIFIIAVILSGICSSFYSPAASSLLVDILDEKILVKGQSANSGAVQLIQMAGTAMSGALLVKFGVGETILINGIAYLIAGLMKTIVTNYPSHNEQQKVNVSMVLNDFVKGCKIVVEDKVVFLMMGTSILTNLFISGFNDIFLAYCLDVGFTLEQYGYLSSIMSLGGVIGIGLLTVFTIKENKQLSIGCISFVISMLIMGIGTYYPSMIFTSACYLICSLLNAFGNGLFNAILVLALPEQSRGVLLGLMTTISTLGCAISSLLYGFLGDTMSLKLLGLIGSVLSAVPFVLCMILLKKVKTQQS